MITQKIFKPNTNGGHDVAPAGLLLLAAECVYGGSLDTTPDVAHDAKKLLDGVLSAARTGGFTQGDILATLLSRNERSVRVVEMAVAACDSAGDLALLEIFADDGMGNLVTGK